MEQDAGVKVVGDDAESVVEVVDLGRFVSDLSVERYEGWLYRIFVVVYRLDGHESKLLNCLPQLVGQS